MERLRNIFQDILLTLEQKNLLHKSPEELRPQLEKILESHFSKQSISLERKKEIIETIENELFAMGPLENLMRDDTITDILINNHRDIFVEKNGKLEKSDVSFWNEDHLLRTIRRVFNKANRRIDEMQPWANARLPSGDRIAAVIPPISTRGITAAIRKFRLDFWSFEKFEEYGAFSPQITDFLDKWFWPN